MATVTEVPSAACDIAQPMKWPFIMTCLLLICRSLTMKSAIVSQGLMRRKNCVLRGGLNNWLLSSGALIKIYITSEKS